MERKRVQRKDREGEDLKHSFVKRQIEWRSELLIVCLLGAFAFFVNRHMEIKGLYMDDLYQWYSYNSESFLQAIFTFGGSRCRFLYNLVAWIEMAIFGPHVGWYVPFNILQTAYESAHPSSPHTEQGHFGQHPPCR
jgi:ABC-type phosphate/phosphonate transport system permease subunit